MTKTKIMRIEKMAALIYAQARPLFGPGAPGAPGAAILRGWWRHRNDIAPTTEAHWVGWLWREMVMGAIDEVQS